MLSPTSGSRRLNDVNSHEVSWREGGGDGKGGITYVVTMVWYYSPCILPVATSSILTAVGPKPASTGPLHGDGHAHAFKDYA